MSDEDRPVGERYTHVYLERGEPVQDSERFRRRVGAFLQHECEYYHRQIAQRLHRELGIQPRLSGGIPDFVGFCSAIGLHNFLDALTVVTHSLTAFLHELRSSHDRVAMMRAHCLNSEWRAFILRALKEENLGYTMDQGGGIHPLVDVEFESARESLVRGMSASRYEGVRAAYEEAHEALKNENTKSAVRSMFEALEILARLMVPKASRLDDATVKRDLRPIVLRLAADKTAASFLDGMMEAFAVWVNRTHIYRHGPGEEQVVAPPFSLAVYCVGSGSAVLRLLLEADAKQQVAGKCS